MFRAKPEKKHFRLQKFTAARSSGIRRTIRQKIECFLFHGTYFFPFYFHLIRLEKNRALFHQLPTVTREIRALAPIEIGADFPLVK